MKVLLDTHCWLWMLAAPERFGESARQLVSDSHTALYLSAASSWEIGIKFSLGKLDLPESPTTFVPKRIERTGVLPLFITHTHALRASELPYHHRDPFDRLLVAQAQLEDLPLLTADRNLAAYDLELITAN